MKTRNLTMLVSTLALAACSGKLEEPPKPASGAVDTRLELATTEPGYWVVRRKLEGGRFVARVDRDRTTCGDRAPHNECKLGELDLGRVDLMPADEQALLARVDLQGGATIFHGKLIPTPDRGDKLVVSEAWVRQAFAPELLYDVPTHGMLQLLRDVREGCEGPIEGCRWLRAEPLTGARSVHHDKLDLSFLKRSLDEETSRAISRGRVLALGSTDGAAFVAGALYTRWPDTLPAGPTSPK
jgi:hypothetical protein